MNLISKLISVLAAAAGIAAMFFKAKADKQQSRAEQAEIRASSAESVISKNEDLKNQRQKLHKKQAEDLENAKANIARGNRDHLDNSW